MADRICTRCFKPGVLGVDFTKNPQGPEGWNRWCRPCRKEVEFFRRWGIIYEEAAERCNYQCGIGGKPEKAIANGFTTSLSADHDYETGEFRGLLCRGCNILVGYFELLIADDYLRDRIRKWIGSESVG